MRPVFDRTDQIPPRYSAKSVGGVRAYRLALKGIEPELKPCKVTIYSIELLERVSETMIRFRVCCSGGTYIRSLCRDIGAKLGYPAYMSALVREANGAMRLENAVTLEEIEKDVFQGFTSIEQFGDSLEKTDFPEDFRKKIENGVKQIVAMSDGLISVSVGWKFYGIGMVKEGELSIIAREI